MRFKMYYAFCPKCGRKTSYHSVGKCVCKWFGCKYINTFK